MYTQLRKCAAGDIIPSLTSLKMHGSVLKFFCLHFRKTPSNQNIKSNEVATFENCEILSNYYFSYVRVYKATLWRVAINRFLNIPPILSMPKF